MQRLIRDTLKTLDGMRDWWLYSIRFSLLLAGLTPHYPEYVAEWVNRAEADCLKVMSAEYLLSEQGELLP